MSLFQIWNASKILLILMGFGIFLFHYNIYIPPQKQQEVSSVGKYFWIIESFNYFISHGILVQYLSRL